MYQKSCFARQAILLLSQKNFSEIDLIFYKILAFDIRWVSDVKYTDVDHGIVQKNRNWT